MATSPTYTLAHLFLPNLIKLKGASTIVSAIERNEKAFFAPVWTQAYVTHDPKLFATTRESTDGTVSYRIGIVGLPAPKDMGDAHMAGFVVKKNDAGFARYFMLEHDWVMATKSNRTVVSEREGKNHSKHFDGPALSGTWETDAPAFVDAFMELLVPTKVARR